MIALGFAGALHGQDDPANPFDDYETPDADERRDAPLAERRIEFILDEPLQSPLEFPETPLNTITGLIQDEYDIPIVFHTAALDAIAVSPDVEITVSLRNITLRSALELMLHEIEDLTYLVDDEVLLITTEDVAESRLEVRVYRVDDLWELARPRDHQTGSGADYSRLIGVITDCIEHDSWMDNGSGDGQIGLLPPGMLVIAQTQRIHAEIRLLLAELRRINREIAKDATADEGSQAQVAVEETEGHGSE
jgi:hypothetical protein